MAKSFSQSKMGAKRFYCHRKGYKMTAKLHVVMLLVLASVLVGAGLSSVLLNGRAAFGGEMAIKPAHPGPVQDTIRTRRVELVDKKGKVRATFALGPDDSPSLNLYDEKGGPLVSLGVVSGPWPILKLQGLGGSAILLLVSSTGSPTMAMQDTKGKARGVFRLGPDGSPVLALQDKRGKSRVVMGRIAPQVTGGAEMTRPISSIVLFDEKEKVIWEAPSPGLQNTK